MSCSNTERAGAGDARVPRRRGALLSRAVAAGLLSALSMCAGCDDDPAEAVDRCIEDSIAAGRQANWIQGVWRISGDGERTSCTDESLNADSMDLSSRGIRVHQQGHFVFIEDAAQNPGFALSGMVGDRCIHVRTSEQTPYGVVHYDLPAFFMTSSSFDGDFTSTGPGTCKAEGQFAVFAKLDAVPANPVANPAPPDAGTSQESLCDACMKSCEAVDIEYIAACEGGCEQYVCHPASVADAGDAETEVADAAEESADAGADADDASDDVMETGADDASDDVMETGADDASDDVMETGADDASDDVMETGADDASDDAAEDGAVDADGLEYVLWDGSLSAGGDGSTGTGSACTLSGAPVRRGGPGATSIIATIVLGWSFRRLRGRRRRGTNHRA